MSGNDVQSYFERSAEAFDRLYAEDRQNVIMRWINRRFHRDIPGRFLMTLALARRIRPENVLDVGCGSGRYIPALATADVQRLVGIDLSRPMLDLARSRAAGIDAEIELHCADFRYWSTEERFDLVVAMGLFDYVADTREMLERMRERTRCAVIASFPSRHWFRTPLRRLRYRIKRCPVFFYDRDTIESTGRQAGFSAVDVTKIAGAGMDYVAVFWVESGKH